MQANICVGNNVSLFARAFSIIGAVSTCAMSILPTSNNLGPKNNSLPEKKKTFCCSFCSKWLKLSKQSERNDFKLNKNTFLSSGAMFSCDARKGSWNNNKAITYRAPSGNFHLAIGQVTDRIHRFNSPGSSVRVLFSEFPWDSRLTLDDQGRS